jgi:hypothetical protein
VEHLLPSPIVGILSLIVLALAIVARYTLHMMGAWRTTYVYVIGAVVALYFNCFVAVVQSFAKISALKALAHTPVLGGTATGSGDLRGPWHRGRKAIPSRTDVARLNIKGAILQRGLCAGTPARFGDRALVCAELTL